MRFQKCLISDVKVQNKNRIFSNTLKNTLKFVC